MISATHKNCPLRRNRRGFSHHPNSFIQAIAFAEQPIPGKVVQEENPQVVLLPPDAEKSSPFRFAGCPMPFGLSQIRPAYPAELLGLLRARALHSCRLPHAFRPVAATPGISCGIARATQDSRPSLLTQKTSLSRARFLFLCVYVHFQQILRFLPTAKSVAPSWRQPCGSGTAS